MEIKEIALILCIIAAIVTVGGFLAFVIYPFYYGESDGIDSSMPTPTIPPTVTPSPIQTPTITTTPTPLTVKITEPKDGGDFPLLDTSKLVGIISYVPDDRHLWIVMLKPPNPIYYPFSDEPAIYGDTWETISYGVGEDNGEQDGDTFIIGAYLLDEKAYEEIKKYVKKSAATDTWEGMYPLPEGATEYDYVSVIGRL